MTRLTAAAATAAAFLVLTVLVGLHPGWLVAFDVDGSRATEGVALAHTAVAVTARVLTWAGEPLVVDLVVLVALARLWSAGRRSTAVGLLVAGVASIVVRVGVKDLLGRARPPHPIVPAGGASFPSGHTTGAAFAAAAAVVVLRRAWVAVVATAAALAVGATRVLLGDHWPSDVVGGLLLGVTFALLVPDVGAAAARRWPVLRSPG